MFSALRGLASVGRTKAWHTRSATTRKDRHRRLEALGAIVAAKIAHESTDEIGVDEIAIYAAENAERCLARTVGLTVGHGMEINVT